jgi:prolyl oligopeptidase
VRSFIALAVLLVVGCGSPPPPAPLPLPMPPPPMPLDAGVATPLPTYPYPAARRVDQVDLLHGVSVPDPYRWLEDAKSEEVERWATDENGFARASLAQLPERAAFAARAKELFYVESAGVPRHLGNRLFYPRRDAGKEKQTIYWREGPTGPEKVLLDPNAWSEDGSVSLGVWAASYDGKRVAYSVKGHNSDEATLYVMDVATGKKSDVDVIEGAKYASPSWTPSGKGFYYTRLPLPGVVPTADRPGFAEVRFHALGTDPKTDALVHEKTGDPKTFVGAAVGKDGRWLIASIEHGWKSTDVYFQDLRSPKPAWTPLVVGTDARYDVFVDRDAFFVWTNDGAPHNRVMRVDPAHPERDHWKEIVAERPDATLESLTIVGHRLALGYLKDVVSQVEIHDEDGKLVRAVALPTIGSASALSGEVDDDVAYYTFQSFTYPTEIFETSVATGKTSTFYKLRVPVDPSKYAVEQLFATSKDGARVPLFVVHAVDVHKDGSSPTMLYGYGGFEIALTPTFSTSIFPWLEHGGVWVVGNLRGGSEYGEDWHRHGMRREKQHVFDDYFAVADAVIHAGFTQPSKLVAFGRSNGGLLVGAAITERPDLFAAALCGVPLLDMIRYPLVGSGKTWVEEYGSPDDADDFAALFAYSPYHHVTKDVRYPAVLLLSADSDDRVDPMHARKFAAELQWASTGGPVLLRVEKNSGHGGADLVRSAVEMLADEYAFALAATK